jgi:hypothetical protein
LVAIPTPDDAVFQGAAADHPGERAAATIAEPRKKVTSVGCSRTKPA